MPIYEYRCPEGHEFEVVQRMSDDPVTECEVCGARVERVFRPVAVHFKGSGFYTTDYARKSKSDGEKKDSADTKKSADTKSDGSDGGKSSGDKPKASEKAGSTKD